MKDCGGKGFERVNCMYMSVCVVRSRVLGMLWLIRWMAGNPVYAPIVPIKDAGSSGQGWKIRISERAVQVCFCMVLVALCSMSVTSCV